MRRVLATAILSIVSLYASAQQASTGLPSPIPAGIGTPSVNSPPCNAGVATAATTSIYNQRDILTGESVWKCKLSTDGVTYSWVAPFISPFMGTGVTAAITPPTLVGCTSGTATVPGAGRKAGEAAGAGTGVVVYTVAGQNTWNVVGTNTPVTI